MSKRTTLIQLWSGPRNISTALMYSFAQRTDTTVVDEPLYAHYLRITGADHPGREHVLSSQENDGNKVMRDLQSLQQERPVLFCKQMTHHLVEIDLSGLRSCQNILLIRHPMHVLASYAKVISNPVLNDIGIKQSYDLFHALKSSGAPFLVVDSGELMKAPEKVLDDICRSVGIPFQRAMLSWKPGPKKEDGVWAKYWYSNVHRSGGFEPSQEHPLELPGELKSVFLEAMPYYEFLSGYSLKA